jgi:ABC-2 type transport system ATP-binding protein
MMGVAGAHGAAVPPTPGFAARRTCAKPLVPASREAVSSPRMIEASHLSKEYGPVKAVNDVSFRVDPGEVVGFLGPNGAGKSTTLRMLAGFLGPSGGTVRIAGHDLGEEPVLGRGQIGYMPETSPLYPEMRVGEYLSFRAELKRVPRRARREAVARALADTGVADVEDVVIGRLSRGYRQRVGLADALVGDPPILILDEPTAGLDPNQIREARALVRRLGKDRAVLVSTHILSEVEATCTRALVIARGRLVAQGSIDEIRALCRTKGIRITVRGEEAAAVRVLSRARGVRRFQAEPGEGGTLRIDLDLDPGADAGRSTEEAVAALSAAGLGVREVTPHADSLEQVFSALTMGAASERGEA